MEMNLTASLSKSELEGIIKDYFNREGFNVDGINFELKSETVGFGPMENSIKVFSGVSVKIRKKPVSYSQFDR